MSTQIKSSKFVAVIFLSILHSINGLPWISATENYRNDRNQQFNHNNNVQNTKIPSEASPHNYLNLNKNPVIYNGENFIDIQSRNPVSNSRNENIQSVNVPLEKSNPKRDRDRDDRDHQNPSANNNFYLDQIYNKQNNLQNINDKRILNEHAMKINQSNKDILENQQRDYENLLTPRNVVNGFLSTISVPTSTDIYPKYKHIWDTEGSQNSVLHNSERAFEREFSRTRLNTLQAHPTREISVPERSTLREFPINSNTETPLLVDDNKNKNDIQKENARLQQLLLKLVNQNQNKKLVRVNNLVESRVRRPPTINSIQAEQQNRETAYRKAEDIERLRRQGEESATEGEALEISAIDSNDTESATTDASEAPADNVNTSEAPVDNTDTSVTTVDSTVANDTDSLEPVATNSVSTESNEITTDNDNNTDTNNNNNVTDKASTLKIGSAEMSEDGNNSTEPSFTGTNVTQLSSAETNVTDHIDENGGNNSSIEINANETSHNLETHNFTDTLNKNITDTSNENVTESSIGDNNVTTSEFIDTYEDFKEDSREIMLKKVGKIAKDNTTILNDARNVTQNVSLNVSEIIEEATLNSKELALLMSTSTGMTVPTRLPSTTKKRRKGKCFDDTDLEKVHVIWVDPKDMPGKSKIDDEHAEKPRDEETGMGFPKPQKTDDMNVDETPKKDPTMYQDDGRISIEVTLEEDGGSINDGGKMDYAKFHYRKLDQSDESDSDGETSDYEEFHHRANHGSNDQSDESEEIDDDDDESDYDGSDNDGETRDYAEFHHRENHDSNDQNDESETRDYVEFHYKENHDGENYIKDADMVQNYLLHRPDDERYVKDADQVQNYLQNDDDEKYVKDADKVQSYLQSHDDEKYVKDADKVQSYLQSHDDDK